MTEDDKEIYQKGVAYLEQWEDVNYCEHSFKFKDEWLSDEEVVDLLNELNDENEQLKQLLDEAEDIIMCQCTPHYQRQWENIKKNLKR